MPARGATLTVETADVDAYWAYWLDGSGSDIRVRLNTRRARFTRTRCREAALHEVLAHGLQSASIAEHSRTHDVPWVRLFSVHAQQQTLLEGLAQALSLFVAPGDEALTTNRRWATTSSSSGHSSTSPSTGATPSRAWSPTPARTLPSGTTKPSPIS
jgi:hypothetical protein